MRPTPKPKNGQAEGSVYPLTFDRGDERQQRAWAVCQQLAAQRRLKHMLLGFLLAVADIQDATGRMLSVEEMMARFVDSIVTGTERTRAPAFMPPALVEESSLIVGSADHAEPREARDKLALAMGDLFGDQ